MKSTLSRTHSRLTRWVVALLLVVFPALSTLAPVQVALAAGVVGDGTPESCTEQALRDRLAGGGLVTFDCGGARTIVLASELQISAGDAPTIIDGGELVTLSGGLATRLFNTDAGSDLTLRNLTLIDGRANRGAAVQNRGALTVINATFENNATTGHGGAILNFPNTSSLTIADSRFVGNSAASTGGGAVFLSNNSNLSVMNSEFSGNSTGSVGGAIRINNGMDVTISGSQFSGNTAADNSGAVYLGDSSLTVTDSQFTGNGSFRAGALSNRGELTVAGSTFENNTATEHGGAILSYPSADDLTLIDTSFVGNSAGSHGGGAVFVSNGGTLTVTSSEFRYNEAQDPGGALRINDGITATISNSVLENNWSGLDGGGIYVGDSTLTITASTFTGNSTFPAASTSSRGDAATRDVTLLNGFEDFYGGALHNTGATTIIGSTFDANSAHYGGALYSIGTLTVIASDFDDNSTLSGNGGALNNEGTGVATVTSSSFTDNTSGSFGGALYNGDFGTLNVAASTFTNNSDAAILNSGELTVTGSTFNENIGSHGGGAIRNGGGGAETWITGSTFRGNSGGSGGAILNDFSAVRITASTFVDNHASVDGGAIDNSGSGAVLVITASTFSGNSAGPGGVGQTIDNSGGINSGTVKLRASIVVDDSPDGNCAGTITSEGYNLSDDGSCNLTGSDINGDADLGPLADNGGPTRTMLPGVDSDALNAIPSTDCATFSSATDQRGVTRPQEAGCEIGAVELNGVVPVQIVSFVPGNLPLNEGDPVTLLARAYGPDNADLDYTLDCANDGFEDDAPSTGNGIDFSADCLTTDDGAFTVALRVCDGGDALNCATAGTTYSVPNNLPPAIDAITLGPVDQGQPVIVTVAAHDPGIDDTLTYSFDCQDDGDYDFGPDIDNMAVCPLDPEVATMTISVLVEDGDGGSDMDSVTVSQSVALCVSTHTGVLSGPMSSGGCPPGTAPVNLPGANPTTVCISLYTELITWSATGDCNPLARPHVIPGSGPLNYCQSIWTNQLRFAPDSQCQAHEMPGVVPGDVSSSAGRR